MIQVTTLRVRRENKRRFDRLQGLVQAEAGARLSQDDLLGRLLDVAERHEAEVVATAEERTIRRKGAITRLLRQVASWEGVETDSSRIDEVLYGEEEP